MNLADLKLPTSKPYRKNTEWYVITGAPSSGKTSVINWLAFHNYRVIPEAARILIDNEVSKHCTLQEIRADELTFQEKILRMKIEAEKRIPLKQPTFWDRGIPDTYAYMILINQASINNIKPPTPEKRYKKIFLLERLPFQKDYARTENEQFADKLHHLLRQTYQNLGYEVIEVSVMTVKERAKFILEKTRIS